MTDNLHRFKALDDAYNARDWDAYSVLLDDRFRGWMQGNATPDGKAEHVRQAQEFCVTSADNRVHNAPYVVAFSDGEWTCTIARFTGTVSTTTHRTFETTFATIARWVGGKIVEEREFLDVAGIMRQINGDRTK